MNFPEEFIKRIKDQQGINGDALIQSLGEPSPVSIRINNNKWHGLPMDGDRVPWCKEGWYLTRRLSFTLDPLFHSGCYYPQEASGMFVGEAFRQLSAGKSEIRVLDLCGAPGGKSTHLASVIGDRGILIANEVIRSRASILAGAITRWGSQNTIVTNSDPASFSALENYFNIISVDAPCSGEGMFRDEIAVKEWSVANTELCAERQKRILMDVWPALKPGGYLIYSTCTFNPSENEENIRWLTETGEGESIHLNIDGFEGITEISYNGITGYGFYPDKIKGEGFFLSVVRRNEESGAGDTGKRKRLARPDIREEKSVIRSLINKEVPLFLRDADDIFAVPVGAEEFAMLKSKLNIIKRGTHLYQVKRDDIIPSHELVVSGLLSEEAFPAINLEYGDAISFLRKENLVNKGFPKGWVIVKYLDINLGLVKNIGSRVNNYFPVGWRILMAAGREAAPIIEWVKQ